MGKLLQTVPWSFAGVLMLGVGVGGAVVAQLVRSGAFTPQAATAACAAFAIVGLALSLRGDSGRGWQDRRKPQDRTPVA
ncbi:hypothetical protein [Botrimarina sp.]|uniref:hypothetical protein n=1 Tax=Botrimarina sp. TaxID=2795802 RepID=UPI0032ED9544